MQTKPHQRQRFYELHLQGLTYPEIAEQFGISKECVRYWYRRQHAGQGPHTVCRGRSPGLLSGFDPKVPYCILRLRLEHPHWGPNRIRAKLKRRRSLGGLRVPSDASIGRYLHQWSRFRRRPRVRPRRPHQPTAVHQRWQLDFKLGIALDDGTLVNLLTIRDPVGEACLVAFLLPAGRVGSVPRRPTLAQVRSALRTCFDQWGTLPDQLQTDGEAILVGQPQDTFPSAFTLWLKGLGIEHLVIRPGRPTDNAEVERCHRTLVEYAISGNEHLPLLQLQDVLQEAVRELTFELRSWAEGCGGRTPVEAHPELLQPRRPFKLEHELALFDLQRVDAYLATFAWERKVSKTGQIEIGGQHRYYSVGRAFSGRVVLVRYDPTDRHFVFYRREGPDEEIGRRPAKWLSVADLTGMAEASADMAPQQLPLPFLDLEGVGF